MSLTTMGLTAVVVAIFAVTLSLVIAQPRGLAIGWSAAKGAVVALLLGVVDIANVVQVWDIVWNATITFVAVIVVSLVLDRIGFFERAALQMLVRAKENAKQALLYLLGLGAVVAAFFANDGAALISTSIGYQQMRALDFEYGFSSTSCAHRHPSQPAKIH